MGDGAAAVPSRFRTICVFCGSSTGHRKVFADAALELGHELVSACVRAWQQGRSSAHRRARPARQDDAGWPDRAVVSLDFFEFFGR